MPLCRDMLFQGGLANEMSSTFSMLEHLLLLPMLALECTPLDDSLVPFSGDVEDSLMDPMGLVSSGSHLEDTPESVLLEDTFDVCLCTDTGTLKWEMGLSGASGLVNMVGMFS